MATAHVKRARSWIQPKHLLVSFVCIAVAIALGRWGTPEMKAPSPAVPGSRTPSCAMPSRSAFLLMGDSLTEQGGDSGSHGWCWRLQQAYERRVDVLNRGLSGWNTKQFREKALPMIAQQLTQNIAPSAMTLWFGANDAALTTGPAASQHVPVDEYQANLVYILTQLRSLAPQATIILISPPVVDDDTRYSIQVGEYGRYATLDRSNKAAGIYAAAAAKAAEAVSGVVFLDMYTYLNTVYPTASRRQKILSDGLHFNAEGNRVVFEKINEQLRSLVVIDSIHDQHQVCT